MTYLLSHINRDRIADQLAEMVRIPSVNPFGQPATQEKGEAQFADYLQQQLEALDLPVEDCEVAPNRRNIWSALPGSGHAPSIALIAHMDTVGVEGYDEPFSGRIDQDGNLHGRGACDMKAAFAAYLEVVRVVKEQGITLPGDLYIIGLVDEEHYMIGSRAYPTHGPLADYGIVGEPTQLQICTAHRGQYGFTISSIGKSIHSSQKEKGHNAIVSMMPVLTMLEQYQADLQAQQPHPLCGHTGVSPNVISGGTVIPIVPDRCELEVDIRYLPGVTAEAVQTELAQRLAALESHHEGAKYELNGPTWNLPAHEVGPTTPIVDIAKRSHQSLFGGTPDLHACPAATDAPNMRFPTIICGPGNLEQAHSTNEFVAIDQVVDAAKFYLHCLLNATE